MASIFNFAFMNCVGLTNLTLPGSITNVSFQAFLNCANLQGLFFKGNRPQVASSVFNGTNTFVYYLSGTTGWGPRLPVARRGCGIR